MRYPFMIEIITLTIQQTKIIVITIPPPINIDNNSAFSGVMLLFLMLFDF